MADQNETISDTNDLRHALARLWIAESECAIARQQMKEAQQQIMNPAIKALKQDIKVLQPKIQQFMRDHDMQRVRTEGRDFILKARKSKCKLDVAELCQAFEQALSEGKSEEHLQSLKVGAYKTTYKVHVPLKAEEEKDVVQL